MFGDASSENPGGGRTFQVYLLHGYLGQSRYHCPGSDHTEQHEKQPHVTDTIPHQVEKIPKSLESGQGQCKINGTSLTRLRYTASKSSVKSLLLFWYLHI